MRTTETPVRVRGKNSEREGVARVRVFTSRDRALRFVSAAIVTLVICVIGALIPPHVVIPLIALPAGVFVAARRAMTRAQIEGGEARCPWCDAPFTIARMPAHWPLDDVCSSCSRHVTIACSENSAAYT